jgi:hypothetical protein
MLAADGRSATAHVRHVAVGPRARESVPWSDIRITYRSGWTRRQRQRGALAECTMTARSGTQSMVARFREQTHGTPVVAALCVPLPP